MQKEQYVSPEFRFQELFLFEGVAAVCWGYHHADIHIFYDADHDDTYDTGEPIVFEHDFVPSEGGPGNGCANVTVAMEEALETIKQAVYDAGYGSYWSDDLIDNLASHENAGEGGTIYIPLQS